MKSFRDFIGEGKFDKKSHDAEIARNTSKDDWKAMYRKDRFDAKKKKQRENQEH
jgi:hypothetical protein